LPDGCFFAVVLKRLKPYLKIHHYRLGVAVHRVFLLLCVVTKRIEREEKIMKSFFLSKCVEYVVHVHYCTCTFMDTQILLRMGNSNNNYQANYMERECARVGNLGNYFFSY